MTKLFALGLMMTGLFLMSSCSSGEDPVLSITSPDDNSDFAAGDILNIKGLATDDSAITRINIASGSPSLLLDDDLNLSNVQDPMSVPINISLSLDTMLTQGAYILNLSATDDDNNIVTESLNFNIR